jgi:Ribonuclease G/E
MGISKKLEDEVERSRLRKILDGLKPPKDCGFIIRTAGIGKSKMEIERDLKYLARLWEQLKKKIDKEKPPVELYTEGDLVTRTVRDVFTSDVDKIIIDDDETAKKVKEFIKLAMPRTKNKVELYDETLPLFHKYDIENEIESIYSRRVPLPSGGSLIIDQTEAVVAIDVNSGKFRDHSDAETTAFKTDLEAADEIPRQLKLRDMGGVIICDFIDLRFERHRRELEERLHNNLKNDRAKTRMLRMSQFGIIEMTRQRMRPSLKKSIYQECTACRAHGMVKTPESMSLDVTRKLRIAAADEAVVRMMITVHPDVAGYMLNRKRAEIATLEDEYQKRVIIHSDPSLPMDEVKFELYDARDGYIYIDELGMAFPQMHSQSKPTGPGGRDRGRDRDRNRDQSRSKREQSEETESIDAEDLFTDEKETRKPLPAKAVPTGGGKAIEQTGNEDEASVVEIDEGGTELPGHAPGAFFEPDDRDRNRHRDRDRNRNRDGRDNRDNRNQGGRDNRDRDNRDDRDNRNRDNRGGQQNRPQGDRPPQRNDQQRNDRPHGDRPQGDRPPNADQQGEGTGRRRRRRRGRRGRGRGGQTNQPFDPNAPKDNRQPAPLGPVGQSVPPDLDYDDIEHDVPAPGNELAEHNTPQAQLQLRDAMAGKDAGRGNRGRRGRGRGRGRGGKNEPQRPAFDRTGLPDDEELEREAAELEARQAQLAAEAETALPTDEMARDDNDSDDADLSDEDISTPPPEAAPAEMDEQESPVVDDSKATKGEKPSKAVKETKKPARPRRAATTKRVPPPQPQVVKTGSVDKHLADDEPVSHDEPVTRPQSYIDLDALPDYDD